MPRALSRLDLCHQIPTYHGEPTSILLDYIGASANKSTYFYFEDSNVH